MAAPKSVASLDFISKFAEHAGGRKRGRDDAKKEPEETPLCKETRKTKTVATRSRRRYSSSQSSSFTSRGAARTRSSQNSSSRHSIFRIGRKLGFIVYYFFDNVTILARITILPSTLEQRMKWILWATLGWAFSVVSNILAITTALIINTREESSLPSDPSRHEDLERIRKNRRTLLIQLLGALGDATIVFSALRVPQMLVRRRLSDAWVGLGGMTSAIATGYLLARRVARKHGFEMKYVVSPVYRGPGS